ncbi:ABC transporter substrate-binding protein [Acidaminobacter hydrogenoformans]|uniref:NitT/TauT family transport system substrate-binding protein n=1 Tax=Acidaminobacter hydrogenoformans DSM 2784 TaxID=1120920 RepID=A0A1G5S1C8_9FIRM|nr:ABC transporter substrate-binding protein [Acidaminobacter hydrogenoformans]SCZ79369.1 NitT/TauT family transport system substrate-binding protein [Acidaminobacter hydrogenoformans DSM 2784]
MLSRIQTAKSKKADKMQRHSMDLHTKNLLPIVFLILLTVLSPLLLTGCAADQNNAEKPANSGPAQSPNKLVIADQFGLAYAPVEILKATDLLSSALAKRGLADVTVEYKRLGNTAAIREAMVSGDLDIGFVAIPPFLIGKDRGMDWRIITGLSESPMALVTKDPELYDLRDLTSAHRILLPQPGSVQHILLSMYAEKTLKDPKAFDNQLMAMSHPDAMMAMMNGPNTQLHFTSPPYLEQELAQEGYKVLIDGEAIMNGPFTFIVGICPQRVYDNTPLYEAFEEALSGAITFMNETPEEAIAILSKAYDYSEADLRLYLSNPQLRFDKQVQGLEVFHDFMSRTGVIRTSENMKDFFWSSKEYEN